MKEITILSGKGGTGKTSITAALASLAKDAVFCDNDVDAADLHLIFHPENQEEHRFFSGWLAEIDKEKCTSCKLCIDYCRFDAIHVDLNDELEINPFQCEGCRLCERICPEQAITSIRNNNNFWYVAKTRFGPFVHARMGAGEENSGKLVSQVRKRAKEIALENQSAYILNDGPPGIGCATISSLSGTDLVVAVIEPTKSGLHDAQRLFELIRTFQISSCALINKFNHNPGMTAQIEEYLKKEEIPLVAKIPFDRQVVDAMIEGKTIIEHRPDADISKIIEEMWEKVK